MEMVFSYPAMILPDAEGGFGIRFPDFPEAISQADSYGEALVCAQDCLDEALAGRIDDFEPIPRPGSDGSDRIEPSVQIAAKVALYQLMRRQGLNGASLARRLEVAETEARRLLDPRHATRLSRLEAAISKLGGRLKLQLLVDSKAA